MEEGERLLNGAQVQAEAQWAHFYWTRNQGERVLHASSRPDVRGLYLSVKCQLEETKVFGIMLKLLFYVIRLFLTVCVLRINIFMFTYSPSLSRT